MVGVKTHSLCALKSRVSSLNLPQVATVRRCLAWPLDDASSNHRHRAKSSEALETHIRISLQQSTRSTKKRRKLEAIDGTCLFVPNMVVAPGQLEKRNGILMNGIARDGRKDDKWNLGSCDRILAQNVLPTSTARGDEDEGRLAVAPVHDRKRKYQSAHYSASYRARMHEDW